MREKIKNFITNNDTDNLKKRLIDLMQKSDELKFLVGFFYFSGIRELYEGLKNNPKVNLKVLVGLNVDKTIFGLIEHGESDRLSDEEKISNFFDSIKKSINSEQFDTRDFYEQVKFFIKLIEEDRLLIRKTFEPNHSKLYIFKLEEGQIGRNKLFITGSSNLTKAGLTTQNEFNVEISDYGVDDAEAYFDKLWENAVKVNEVPDLKKRLVEILKNETLIKEITPFEAYCLVLQSYIDSYEHKDIGTYIIQLFEKNGYKTYQYQLDAVKQALSIIEKHNGVLIADVVGLGKTIIACAVARHLKERGIVICPPGLIGDDEKTEGWKKYLDQFQLFDWEVRSLGDLEKTLNYVKSNPEFRVIIVDEAHRFRNEDTKSYELLKNICRNKKVILLTATPFNNKPQDILTILKLFITPKKSTITLDNNLVDTFREFSKIFDGMATITKYAKTSDVNKREKARTIYQAYFNETEINLSKVKSKTHYLAKQIRNVIEPVTIRRNRLDLTKHPYYQNEVKDLSQVENPIEWFYELTSEQSIFYDKIISEYFGDPDFGGKFSGAIYRPFEYEEGFIEIDEALRDKEKNREFIQQRNLFDIMRRLVVKRFESSFGAFEKSISNFKRITTNVLEFMTKTGKGNPLKGEYILDRDLLEKILDLDEDEIEQKLIEYENQIKAGVYPKKHKRYKIEIFRHAQKFIDDINSDIILFDEILKKLDELKLVENDPKAETLLNKVRNKLAETPRNNEPKGKIVIFSEYADTVKHIYNKIEQLAPDLSKRTLMVTDALPESKIITISHNFDASSINKVDDYDILVSTDKLSEGFNLNRAQMVINYDIPWNPVRVIQRLGRINRISKKVFESLYIVNFFPTERGAELVRSREIAQNKMFMIHNTLGEDSKIFDIDEEPSPANLYNKLMRNPETGEEESFYTKVLNIYQQLKEEYPTVINSLKGLPKRIKVIKPYNENEMLVFFKKNQFYIKCAKNIDGKVEINDTSLEIVLEKILCTPDTKSIDIDDSFWNVYEEIQCGRQTPGIPSSALSIERKALNNLEYLLRDNQNSDLIHLKKFIRMLREDIIDYGTLPDYTLRRIANLNLKNENLKEAIEAIETIKNELGEEYLYNEKMQLSMKDKEIIIAIENRIILPLRTLS